MKRSLFAAALAYVVSLPAAAQTEIQWWRCSMTGGLQLGHRRPTASSASQKEYKVVPVCKGLVRQSMTAAIARPFRAGNAPHILQVFSRHRHRDGQQRAPPSCRWARCSAMRATKFDPGHHPAVVGYYCRAQLAGC